MDCKQERNLKNCNCSYDPCSRKGICCECLRYHLNSRQLPGCCFPEKAEKTFDRSFEHFARLVAQGRV
ncbi:MAG: cytosolic protein [Syntrophobacteraceae bacterium]|nr:cytosolic protein [Syntrophobacteraceae bacterium]